MSRNSSFFSILIKMLVLAGICLSPFTAWAVSPEIVPTYENLGISWAAANRGSGQTARVQYRVQGSSAWNDAQDLWYDARSGGEYKGSIVSLHSGTTYEVKLTLSPNGETVTALSSTWDNNFLSGDDVEFTRSSNATSGVTISTSGTANDYYIYDCDGHTIDANGGDGITIGNGESYIVVRNCTITDADDGIYISPSAHHIVIEDNTITNFSRNGIYAHWNSNGHTTGYFTIQRNVIGPTTRDSQSWVRGHPNGPQGIQWWNGQNPSVIRYNKVFSDYDHMYNDTLGGGANANGESGFPGHDSDIYGNDISHAWDEMIEAEGGSRNVRIWNNYLHDGNNMIATVTVSDGPMYIFRNVFGNSQKWDCDESGSPCAPPNDDSDHWDRGYTFKIGANSGHGDGRVYIYHNTTLQEDPGPGMTYTLGPRHFLKNTNDPTLNYVVKNNIADTAYYGGSKPYGYYWDPDNDKSDSSDCTNDVDYNLYNGNINDNCSSNPHEANGINNSPTYDSSTLFDPAAKEFSQALAGNTLGYDDGVVLSNFNDGYVGSGPDMGAVEHGNAGFRIGVGTK